MVYVGTYSEDGRSAGIHRFRFDEQSGALEPAGVTEHRCNPTWLAAHEGILYSANTTVEDGSVSAFAIERGTGALRLLGSRPALGSKPCHLAITARERLLLAANFGSGNVVGLPMRGDGSLGEPTVNVQHRGGSVHPERQTGPHAHAVAIDPAGRRALVADLGIDHVMIYDIKGGALTPCAAQPSVAVAAGRGPRHLAFAPGGAFFYLVTEMGNTVEAFRYDEATGAAGAIQSVSTLPAGFAGRSHGAEIAVAGSGRFLVASNRGHDTLALFAIDQGSGRLEPVAHASCGGKSPRAFAFDATEHFVLVANQASDDVVVLRARLADGIIEPTGHRVSVPAAVCVCFAEAR